MKKILVEHLLKQALLEDIPHGDITTDNLIDDKAYTKGYLIAKEDGVLAGLKYFKQVFRLIDPMIEVNEQFSDGGLIKKGDIILEISGKTRAILNGERLALNILQRMSGIATLTKQFVDKIKKTNCRICDTRKTTPNFRVFEKEAVLLGGGFNHRYNLSDAVLIKDNHIASCGSVKNAIDRIRVKVPHTTKIEVEVENLEMMREALDAKADIIMLDNMSLENMIEAVELNNHQSILEASGNMTLERIENVAKTGVDYISIGALTHSYRSLDISLRFKI